MQKLKKNQILLKKPQEKLKENLTLIYVEKKTDFQKRNAGYVPLHSTLRKTAQIYIVSTVISQAILKNTATKGKRITYSIGYGKCSLNRKRPMIKDGKGK